MDMPYGCSVKVEKIKSKNNCALVIATYLSNAECICLLQICIDSIKKFCDLTDVSIWVCDVGSPLNMLEESGILNDPEVNVVHTDFVPRSWEGNGSWLKRSVFESFNLPAPRHGALANALSLDLAVAFFATIDYRPSYFMSLHMDTMFTSEQTLHFLRSKLGPDVAAVGVRRQKNLGTKSFDILHPLGCLWKFSVIRELGLKFAPVLPEYDCGEKAVISALLAGYTCEALLNTVVDPEARAIEVSEEWLNDFWIDKVLVEYPNAETGIGFLHMGRGIIQAEKGFPRLVNIEDWSRLSRRIFLGDSG